jgi:hypothetical protein
MCVLHKEKPFISRFWFLFYPDSPIECVLIQFVCWIEFLFIFYPDSFVDYCLPFAIVYMLIINTFYLTDIR